MTLSKTARLYFFTQLTSLYLAGITLIKSLKLIADSAPEAALKQSTEALLVGLESGYPFHVCLAQQPAIFDQFTCQLILLGEESGSLHRILPRLRDEQAQKQKRQAALQQALLYPCLLALSAGLTLLLLFLVVVPHFELLLEHFPQTLPLSTRLLFNFSTFFRHSLLLLIPIGIWAAYRLYRITRQQTLGSYLEETFFKLPLCRTLLLKLSLSTLTRHLATALTAGLPLSRALPLCAPLSRLKVLEDAFYMLECQIQAGEKLSTALEAEPLFPKTLIQLARLAEETGQLDLFLEKFSDLLDQELEQQFKRVQTLLEPLLILILGVLIGGVIIALYLPIFHLGTAFS